jgi:hypothetical protein
MVSTIICEVCTIMCDIGTIDVRFYLLKVSYPHGYYTSNILKKTNDVVITLQGVLEGKHDRIIDETLNQY